jgi:hypothetical protein
MALRLRDNHRVGLGLTLTRRRSSGGNASLVESVDVVVIAGQSNATASGGTAATTPNAVNGIFWNGTAFSSLADGPTSLLTATMWPAWSNEWYALTGRKTVFIQTAVGSTRLLDYGVPESTWAPTGTLREASLNAAILGIGETRKLYNVVNIYYAWVQGEGDAENLDGSHTAAQYETALQELAEYFKDGIPELTSMPVIRSGINITDRTKDAGYYAIRNAQDAACDASEILVMAYRGTLSFRPLGYITSDVHYTQPGKNLAGKCGARGLYSPEIMPTINPLLGTEAFPDTNYATSGDSRTVAVTTASGTTFVVVIVSAIRGGSSTNYSILGVTFDGVAMTLAREQNDGGTPTACRTATAIYYLTEAAYGASLSAITKNVVATVTTAVPPNIFNITVVYADSNQLVGGATGTEANVVYYSGAPALLVGGSSSSGAGAAAFTGTSNGLNEILDAGGSNGTRNAQSANGYDEHDEVFTRTVGVTFSGTCECLATVAATFRQHWAGEV